MYQQTPLSKELDTFSKGLVPSEDYIREGNATADRIFNLLKRKSRFSIDRVKIVGSIGKKTAVCVEPDFDLVVFVNNQEPFFKNVLDDFHNVLLVAEMDIESVELSRFSIQFKLNNISFDLLPATNFVTMTPQPGGATLAKLQADGALKKIKSDPKVGYRYGSAVCEETVEFLKQQSPYVHDVIRLAKFWSKTLIYLERMSGRSTMIELIAISAARELETTGNRSCLDGFKQFLKCMCNFDNICVIFPEFYSKSDVPSDVMRQRPLVLDPVNPYNNYGYGAIKEPRIIQQFKEFAKITLQRLDNSSNLDVLFEIQPKVLEGQHPGYWLVSVENSKLLNPKMEVRISDKEYKAKEWGVKEVQQCLLTTMATLTLGGSSVDIAEVKKKVHRTVDLNILGRLTPREWGSSDMNHEDQNITLWVPIPGDQSRCIKLSVTW